MEHVILVNENDQELGSMEKMEAHEKGILHRAFSIFLFDEKGEMLLQRRAKSKYHSGGLWTNTCCSHPRPNESTLDAAKRRLKEEMGIDADVKKIFDFKYRAELDMDLIEHEFDHVFFGKYSGAIFLNKEEVEDYKYLSINELKADLEKNPESYTEWFKIAWHEVRAYWEKAGFLD